MSLSSHREQVQAWARSWFERGFVVLDTETTGLNINADEIVDIAVVRSDGATLMSTLVQPDDPSRLYAKNARGICAHDIHGIGREMLLDAPRFPSVWKSLETAVGEMGVLIYNAGYDSPLLRSLCQRHGLPYTLTTVEDIMDPYARWVGEWNDYHGNWRWQPLPSLPDVRKHRAFGDCMAALAVMRTMAGIVEDAR